MKKTRILALILVLAFAFSLVACSGGNSGSNSGSNNTQTAKEDEKYVLVYSYFAPDFIGPSMFIKDAAKDRGTL